MNTGWICPKCEKVFAPTVVECAPCNEQLAVKQPDTTVTITWPPLTGTGESPFKWHTTTSGLQSNSSTCPSVFVIATNKGQQ